MISMNIQGANNPHSDLGDWLYGSNAYTDDGNSSVTDAATKLHIWYGFLFDIPASATIKGIVIEANLFHVAVTGTRGVMDISPDAVNFTSAKAQAISATETKKTYGSSTDTWGRTWTPSEINKALFSARLKITGTYIPDVSFGYNQWIRATVYYTVAGNIYNQSSEAITC
jgi:hypothetical protein